MFNQSKRGCWGVVLLTPAYRYYTKFHRCNKIVKVDIFEAYISDTL